MDKKIVARAAAAVLLAGCAVSASAQKAGTWFGGVGATRIAPNTESGNLSPPAATNTQVDVGADTQPTFFVGYMLTDNWSVEIPIGFGFEHDINGAGGIAGTGRIGTTKVLPVSAFVQYRFLEPTARFRPYVLGGITYAYFYGESGSAALNALNPANPPGGTSIDVDKRFGWSLGLGMTYAINERWFIDAHYARTWLRTTTTLNSGQKIDTKLDPDVWTVGVGYRF
ncbi:OmpW family protein [Ramlibacter sp. USB13]|uniref:OmpW family protein n=1 Tax=Ramlibacter cellulosilyticus TaxID=2764187 RepID=A0A923MTS1_9BURK|nr:OmpW family outer membrane protein [Ramlibacter cellulosilyticus]MBC5785240.1 OmpW family protein [Ramlibacter cellulosilyticus]